MRHIVLQNQFGRRSKKRPVYRRSTSHTACLGGKLKVHFFFYLCSSNSLPTAFECRMHYGERPMYFGGFIVLLIGCMERGELIRGLFFFFADLVFLGVHFRCRTKYRGLH